MKKRIIFALLLMGFTSLVVQILLIREFLVCFYGNELTIGLILGNWIILETIGSGLASKISYKNKSPLLFYCLLQCLIALYFPCAVYLIRDVKNFLPIVTGEAVGIIPILISSFFILAPLSILDGAQFPFGCRIWKDYTKKDVESVGIVYIFEAMGFIIAGPIFTYLFITRLHSFQIAILIGVINLFSAFLLIQKETKFFRKKILALIIILILSIGAFSIFSNLSNSLNNFSLKKQWSKYTLIESKNSIYGNLAVTKQAEQYTFFSDGIPIITTPVPDIITTEEFIHFGMLSHPNPLGIFIVGGGAGGPISEILKYPVKHLDYAELDPLLIKIIEKYPTALTQKELTDPRVSIKIIDGARYIKATPYRYDIVFINLPPPTTLQLNRFYTKDFFASAKKVFKDENSILVISLPGSLSYLNDELKKLNLSILNTLKDTFKFVKVIPGDSNLYLASKSDFPLTKEIFVERLKEKNIQTRALTSFHIQQRLLKYWTGWFYTALAKTPKTQNNSSLLPKGLFYGISYWNTLFSPYLSKFFNAIEKINLIPLLIPIILLSGLIFFISLFNPRFKKLNIPYAILTTGLTAMAFNLIIIFIYQSYYGYVYQHIAILITAFMLGLTLGGWLITKRIARIKNRKLGFIVLESGAILFALASLPLFIYLGEAKTNLSFIFFLFSTIIGFIAGAEFPLANSLYQINNTTQTAGILYAVDLLGSWIGALIVSVVFLPVIGLIGTCIFLIILKLSSLLLVSLLCE